mgnify:FL=1
MTGVQTCALPISAIFTSEVLAEFAAKWGGFGFEGGGNGQQGTPIGMCQGWMLAAAENPFGTGDVDCL